MSARLLAGLLAALALPPLVAGCYVPGESVRAGARTPTAPILAPPPAPSDPRPTPTPAPTLARLVLTTAVGADDAPAREMSAIPAGTRRVFVAVQIGHLRHGVTVRATWRREGSEIARSERVVRDGWDEPRWLALALDAERGLPAGEYAVEVAVDDALLDSLVFPVGHVGLGDDEPRLVFAGALGPAGEVPEGTTRFPPDTRRVVAVLTHLQSDGTGLVSHWTRDGAPVAEIGPDPLVSPAQWTFTLQSPQPLPAGHYRVEVALAGEVVAAGEFDVGSPPTPTPEPTPTARSTPPATATPAPDSALADARLVAAIDPATAAPTGPPLTVVDGPAIVYLALRVRALAPGDTLSVEWRRDGAVVARGSVSGRALADEWVVFPYAVPDGPAHYEVDARVNGAVVRALVFEGR